jgi:hypothetical protein
MLAAVGWALSAYALWGGDERDARGSTQQCNTACQEKMTDCILDCDGVLSCELACKAAAVGCVIACTDGGAPRAPERSFDAGIATRTDHRVDASTDGGEDGASRAARLDVARDGGRTAALPRDP